MIPRGRSRLRRRSRPSSASCHAAGNGRAHAFGDSEQLERSIGQLAPAQHAAIRERFLTQRSVETRRDLAAKTAAVHGVNPTWIDLLNAIDDPPHRRLVSKDPSLAIEPDHSLREIFFYDRGLVARLDEKISGKEAARGLLHDHQ